MRSGGERVAGGSARPCGVPRESAAQCRFSHLLSALSRRVDDETSPRTAAAAAAAAGDDDVIARVVRSVCSRAFLRDRLAKLFILLVDCLAETRAEIAIVPPRKFAHRRGLIREVDTCEGVVRKLVGARAVRTRCAATCAATRAHHGGAVQPRCSAETRGIICRYAITVGCCCCCCYINNNERVRMHAQENESAERVFRERRRVPAIFECQRENFRQRDDRVPIVIRLACAEIS